MRSRSQIALAAAVLATAGLAMPPAAAVPAAAPPPAAAVPAAAPPPIPSVQVTKVSANTIDFSWTRPVGTDYAGVTVRRVTGTTAPTAHSGTLVADFGNTITHASDYGLTASKTYTYALFARDSTQHYARGLSFTRTTPTPPATPDWTSTTVWPLSGSPTALSCAAPATCTVVDWHGFEVHWDGTTWSAPARVADQPLLWITCNSSDFCMSGN